MRTILYYGMENKPIQVNTRQYINNRYQTVTEYYNTDGKRIMFKAQKNSIAYDPPCNYMQYPNYSRPMIPAGSIVNPDVINKGYSSHDFNIVIM